MFSGNAGCLDRASFADGIEGAKLQSTQDRLAFDTIEDCLSESRYTVVPPEGDPQL